MSITAIVPIKQHSYRLPGKNFIDFCGKPLYQWVVDAALETRTIDKVYVSSSWIEFKDKLYKVYGDKVGFIHRPAALNHVELMEVMKHAATEVGQEGDIFIQLTPTKPLTRSLDLSRFIDTFKTKKLNSLFQVQEIKESVDWEYKSGTDKGKVHIKSCAMAKMFDYNTLINAKQGTWGFGEKHYDVVVPNYHIEIDTLEDFKIAEALKLGGF